MPFLEYVILAQKNKKTGEIKHIVCHNDTFRILLKKNNGISYRICNKTMVCIGAVLQIQHQKNLNMVQPTNGVERTSHYYPDLRLPA